MLSNKGEYCQLVNRGGFRLAKAFRERKINHACVLHYLLGNTYK